MFANQNDTGDKPSVTLPVIIGLIALLVAFLGWQVYHYVFAPTGPRPVKTATSDWLEKIARESGGDYEKLSPEDKAKVDKIPFGGREWLKRKYDSLH